MVQFAQYPVPADLRRWVRLIWTLCAGAAAADDALLTAGAQEAELVVPDGFPEIIFNLADPFEQRAPGRESFREQSGAIVNGQLQSAIHLRAMGRVHLVGIRLQPWALGSIVRTPAAELTDTWAAIGDITSNLLPNLHDALIERGSGTDVSEVVVSHLRQQLARTTTPPDRCVSAVRLVAAHSTALNMRHVRKETGMSERAMQRMFASEVGCSPKHYAKIIRVQEAVCARRENPRLTWSRAASDAGYYDQSHFNKDFRAVVGCAPTELLVEQDSLTANLLTGGNQNE